MGDGGTGRLEDEKEMLPDSWAERIIQQAWTRVNSIWSGGMADRTGDILEERKTMYDDLNKELNKSKGE